MIFLITLTLIFCSCIEVGLLAVYDRGTGVSLLFIF